MHQSVFAPARRVTYDDKDQIAVRLSSGQQHKEDQNFEVISEPRLLSLGDHSIELIISARPGPSTYLLVV